jgi:hypothetical protein
MDFAKTSFDGFVDARAIHFAPFICGDSDALVAAEVERISSNLMALIAPLRSRTNMASKNGEIAGIGQ